MLCLVPCLIKLENTEGAIKNGQSRETGNTWHIRRRKAKQKHTTICAEHQYAQKNVTKTCTDLQITVAKDEPNIVFKFHNNSIHGYIYLHVVIDSFTCSKQEDNRML